MGDIAAERTGFQERSEKFARRLVGGQEVESAVVDGHGHHLVESVEELLEPRPNDARRRFELRWVFSRETKEEVAFGRRQPEGPLESVQDLARRPWRASLLEARVVLDRDPRRFGEFLTA
ncbi:hypothetical protein GCM10025780_36290 [Frondihabitans cladoniiphilus]|uniref:Uncharacterized protein n=1 Tax=Frondihabitans cladoniiphilus TaxID=715785 RepID=A0ABP8WBQ6_9MICO